ncbi:sodium- and chloride-dependent glycine transporter 2-like [Amblyomma americanum]
MWCPWSQINVKVKGQNVTPFVDRRRRAGVPWDGGSFDEIRAQSLLSLAAVWVLVFALARHGLTSARRFFYAMVLLHLVTTALLLVRGAALPGGLGGLGMLFYADWGSVVDVEMWSNALYVCLESVGVTGSVYLGVARLNNFKNDYHEDVTFVLAADTASKGLRTVITFMFLGHLSASIGVDVQMLVDSESDPSASIVPQAMSAVPWPPFWGHVHSLWIVSTVLPKFLIVPDILLELLAASHPLVVANRTLVHFFLCALLVTASTVVCSPGGATMASIFVHYQDRDLRFLVLFLESVVVLQFCGALLIARMRSSFLPGCEESA